MGNTHYVHSNSRPVKSWMVRLLRALAGERAAAALVRRRLEDAFDPEWYMNRYPDVRGCDPLVHYAAWGAAEGRDPHPLFHSSFYTSQYPQTASEIPADNYLREGVALRRRTHPQRGFCLIPPLRRPLRIATLLVRHGTERYPGADVRAESILRCSLPSAVRRTIIIDNSLSPATKTRTLDDTSVLIAGDNTSWEFSGWDAGLRYLGEQLHTFDFVHFATDAFEQFGAAYTAQLDTRVLEALRYGPAVAGHIDFYNEIPLLAGKPVPCWIRSSWFFLRPSEVAALKAVTTFTTREGIFSGDPKQPFLHEGPVDSLLASYIIGWLTGEGTGQGVQWHSRFELGPDTLTRFEGKARAILNELSLSVRLRELGCWMADALWSRAVLEGSVAGKWFEESWNSQVAKRPTTAVITL